MLTDIERERLRQMCRRLADRKIDLSLIDKSLKAMDDDGMRSLALLDMLSCRLTLKVFPWDVPEGISW